MGTSPIEYLTGWRMLVGADKLTSCDDFVAGLALSVGYKSESAFGAAFQEDVSPDSAALLQVSPPRSQRFSRHLGLQSSVA
jgi:transcriptional regulator GlxA family with amidase domain